MSKFRLICLLKILLLSSSLILFFYLLEYTDFIVTLLVMGILIFAQIINLINFVESTNKHITQFLESISQSDFSQSPNPGNLGSTSNELREAYQKVLKLFKESRAETEEQARYLQMVVQHVKIGLIGYDQDGQIEILNNTAKKYLQCYQTKTLQDLEKLRPLFTKTILAPNFKPNTILKVEYGENYLQLILNVSHLQFRNTKHTLISMSNIQSELEEKEMEAWQNLIRVLTHEINNSITPISSLSATTHSMLNDLVEQENSPQTKILERVKTAVTTIKKRSDSLITFVENYRKLTRIPSPEFQHIRVKEMFDRVSNLLQTEFETQSAQLVKIIEPTDLKITCDPNLIEQVLINLLKNALSATAKQNEAKIEMAARYSDLGKIRVEIIDNGQGIETDVIDKIFIPFFTTKTDGSGIGLSFSRQIMRQHGGSIKVYSKSNEYTRFVLIF